MKMQRCFPHLINLSQVQDPQSYPLIPYPRQNQVFGVVAVGSVFIISENGTIGSVVGITI